jgi:hypothetical protein
MARTLETCLHPNGRRKVSYRSPAKARQAVKDALQRLRWYHCPSCGYWHVAELKQPRQRQRAGAPR